MSRLQLALVRSACVVYNTRCVQFERWLRSPAGGPSRNMLAVTIAKRARSRRKKAAERRFARVLRDRKIRIDEVFEVTFVVRGRPRRHRRRLECLGGRWDIRLKGGSGWVFDKSRQQDVRSFISSISGSSARRASGRPGAPVRSPTHF